MTDATLALGALIGAPAAPAAAGAATPTAGADFLALVQDLLGQSGGEQSTEASGPTGDGAPPVTVGGEVSTVPAAGSVEGAPLPGGDDADDADDTDDTEAGDDAVLTSVPGLVLPPALLRAVVAAATARSAAAPAGDASEPAGTAARPETAGPPPFPATATVTAAAPAPPPAPATEQAQPSQQPALTPVVAAPVAPAAPAALTATPPATTTAPPARVTHQVFPEVLRVAGLGDGPKRVTVRLQPENLGEVRVVLTSRRGELQVSLSASGGEAHRALVEGTPELRRLLDAVGSTDARVVVRDLPTSPAGTSTPVAPTSQTATGSDVRGDLAGGAGAGNRQAAAQSGQQDGRQDGRPGQSPTRGSNTAMDGTPDATSPLRRTESVTRARAGLDVTV